MRVQAADKDSARKAVPTVLAAPGIADIRMDLADKVARRWKAPGSAWRSNTPPLASPMTRTHANMDDGTLGGSLSVEAAERQIQGLQPPCHFIRSSMSMRTGAVAEDNITPEDVVEKR